MTEKTIEERIAAVESAVISINDNLKAAIGQKDTEAISELRAELKLAQKELESLRKGKKSTGAWWEEED